LADAVAQIPLLVAAKGWVLCGPVAWCLQMLDDLVDLLEDPTAPRKKASVQGVCCCLLVVEAAWSSRQQRLGIETVCPATLQALAIPVPASLF